jgi:putative methyltransferase
MGLPQLTPALALVLVHDQLLSKRGIAAPSGHPLAVTIAKHKTRLNAEFSRLRVKRGYATVEAFRAYVNARQPKSSGGEDVAANDGARSSTSLWSQVRWVRINTLRTNLAREMQTTFSSYRPVASLVDLVKPSGSGGDAHKAVFVDQCVPELLATPRSLDLTQTRAYREGYIIYQNKASCFPPLLLDIPSLDGDIVDACAAPGNKTTHLAALLKETGHDRRAGQENRIWAIERDRARAETLRKAVALANAADVVTVQAGQDFLRLKPEDEQWRNVRAVLLDPSCSGSGMLGRSEWTDLELPEKHSCRTSDARRSRKPAKRSDVPKVTGKPAMVKDEGMGERKEILASRLASLSAFQLKMLIHAFNFPSALRVVYSTCSIHAMENEDVVVRALGSHEAQKNRWRLLARQEQVPVMQTWQIRGDHVAVGRHFEDSRTANEVANACIRCERGGEEATTGFFVACFIRGNHSSREEDQKLTDEHSNGMSFRTSDDGEAQDSAEEWNGFSDDIADSEGKTD